MVPLVVAAGGCTPAGMWTLAEIDGAAAQPGAVLRLQGRRISGTDGCNAFTGRLETGPWGWRLGDLQSTLRACADADARGQSERVSMVLSGDPVVGFAGDRLTLSGPGGRLDYRPAFPHVSRSETSP
ncbi:META domain-containing protein [Brevundimonas diminuta]|uniref:META domain-containing protein n=1 Tax=Brevundimonas diminuta TaxID=293 RepID=UPI0012F84CE2|nr:META domain-containing protein [Brevundimonas diminuta]